MSGTVVDTSVWIEFFAGRGAPQLEEALARRCVVVPPIVAAELISGARRPEQRNAVAELLAELPLHETPPEHWVRVGELRRRLADRGLAVSTPDAHVAQCALDRQGLLLSRDAVFGRIARLTRLRIARG